MEEKREMVCTLESSLLSIDLVEGAVRSLVLNVFSMDGTRSSHPLLEAGQRIGPALSLIGDRSKK